GGPAIVSAFLPSYLVYKELVPAPVVAAVTEFTRTTNFIYLFISAVVVGSILGMDRTLLIRGFFKIFAPLAAGSVVAAIAGMATGWIAGLPLRRSFFFIITPIMAGGVGEGAIPLSTGYTEILGRTQGEWLAQVLPVALFGNLIAVVIAGALNAI